MGNVGYYSNRLAVEWIATRLAPALVLLRSPVRVRILGIDDKAVPAHWRAPNVDYLDVGDSSIAAQEFCSADLFLAPIANAFGSKIKLLDCLAHGTPFAATHAALSGIPFVRNVPKIELDRPVEAAEAVTAALADPVGLMRFSKGASAGLAAQRITQLDVWRHLLIQTARSSPKAEVHTANEDVYICD